MSSLPPLDRLEPGTTALALIDLQHNQIFAIHAMAARVAADHAHAGTRISPRLGRVRQSEEIVRALRRGRALARPSGPPSLPSLVQ